MKSNRILAFVAFALVLLLTLGLSNGAPAAAQSATPGQPGNFSARLSRPNDQAPYYITFQGRLTDHNGNPITNAVNILFNLYTVPSAGNTIFTEGPIIITPNSQGLLIYQVGSATPINAALIAQFASSLYLGVSVGDDSEMTPRLALTAAPYAMSLAPGAVISGTYSGIANQHGVVNAINTNYNSTQNAALYGNGVVGVWGDAHASGSTNGYGGLFTNMGGSSAEQYGIQTNVTTTGGYKSYGGDFNNFGGGSADQYGIRAYNKSTGGHFGIGGYFQNDGGGNGRQYGIQAEITSTNGANNYAGSFTNYGGGSGSQYGIYAINYASGLNNGYGGYFYNTATSNYHNFAQYGIYSYAATSGGAGGYSGYIDSNSSSATSLRVSGKLQATGGCCASPFYDIQVKYHGSTPLHPGDVVAMDGNNETVDGTSTLGVVKAIAANAKAAIGVVQYRFKAIGKEEQSGLTDWQVDETSTSFASGDLLSAVVLGQVQMKVGQAGIGDRVALTAAGSPALAGDGSKYTIGKVVSAPDKDGYVTVFVNLKLGMRYEVQAPGIYHRPLSDYSYLQKMKGQNHEDPTHYRGGARTAHARPVAQPEQRRRGAAHPKLCDGAIRQRWQRQLQRQPQSPQ